MQLEMQPGGDDAAMKRIVDKVHSIQFLLSEDRLVTNANPNAETISAFEQRVSELEDESWNLRNDQNELEVYQQKNETTAKSCGVLLK